MAMRIQKVEELLRQQLSKMIQENLPEDFGIVIVTDVAVTADFKNAKVYISLINKDQEKAVLDELNNRIPEFESLLKQNLVMRYTPHLEFGIDRSQEKIERVEELLKEIKNGS